MGPRDERLDGDEYDDGSEDSQRCEDMEAEPSEDDWED